MPVASILLVDDDRENQTLLRLILERGGHALRIADGGEQALAEVAGQRPDLVLLDAMLPDIDGYEVCRRMRANPRLAALPILFFSARNDEQSRARAYEAGATEFISKSLSPKELLSRVSEAASRSSV